MTPSEASIGRILAIGVLQGLWTLEHLDAPAPGSGTAFAEEARRRANARAVHRGHRATFPPPPPHRNLAREWIDANREEWDRLLLAHLAAEDPAPLALTATDITAALSHGPP
jgi:hypothetical protein